MPDETIDVFADHGKVECDTITQNIEEAEQVLAQLGSAVIDLDFVTNELVNEGIQKFIDPFDSLMDSLKKKI